MENLGSGSSAMVRPMVSDLRPTFALRLGGADTGVEVRSFALLDPLDAPIRLEVSCAEIASSPAQLLGDSAAFTLSLAGETRTFTGLVTEAARTKAGSDLVVESSLVALTDRRRHRVLPASTDLELARRLLLDHRVDVTVSSPPSDAIQQRIQRDETDLQLLQRVLRSVGSVLVHRHAAGRSSLEIAAVESLGRTPRELELGACLRASRRSSTYAVSCSVEAGAVVGQQLVTSVRLRGSAEQLQIEIELSPLDAYRACAQDEEPEADARGRNNSAKPGEGNELVFQDKAGKELALLNAERDLKMVVKNNDDKVVGKNRSAQIKGNDAEHISGNKKASVLGQVMESVGGDALTSILGNLVSQVGRERILQTLGELASSARAHRISSQEGTTFSVGQSMIHMTPELIILQAPKILVNPGAEVGLEAALTGRIAGEGEKGEE